MTANDLLDMIGNVNDSIIEEAKERKKPAVPAWTRWVAAAACLCLVAGAIFAIAGGTNHGITGKLPKIAIPEYGGDGMGFEGILCRSAEELAIGNPWREDAALDTLPVYRNGSYDPSGAGEPLGLNEAEMRAELERAAKALGLTALETEADAYRIRAAADEGSLTVYADGSLTYELPAGYELPEGHHLPYSDPSDPEGTAAMAYLTEAYAALLDFDHPETVLRGEYTFDGDYMCSYMLYDAGTDLTESILNYCFRGARFVPDENGALMLVRLSDGLRTAEKLGDYPLISVSEAKAKLLAGQYQTSVPGAMPGEEYVAKTELIYRTGPKEETLLPYYRFYVELPDADGAQDSGIKTFGAYYVPAIRDDYISNLPTYNGDFN